MATKQTQTTQTEPYTGEMRNRFMSFGDFLQGRMGYNPQYSGPLSANMNDSQLGAIGNLNTVANNPMLQRYAGGEFLDPTKDANVQRQVDAIRSNASEAWGNQGGQINSMFNNRGIYGGSAHQSALQDAATNLNRSTSGTIANVYGNAANAATQNMFNAQGALQSGANALLNAGNVQHNIEDTAAQRQYGEFLRQLGVEQQNIGNLSNWFNMGRNGSTSTTSGDGGAAAGAAIGKLGAAAITACFVAGTKISTPYGDKNIEDVKVGDKVDGVDGVEVVTWVQEPMISPDEYMTVFDNDRRVTTTSTQAFITPDGDKYPRDMNYVLAEKELVYDLSTTGSNTYYANGFAVRGRE